MSDFEDFIRTPIENPFTDEFSENVLSDESLKITDQKEKDGFFKPKKILIITRKRKLYKFVLFNNV